MMIHGHNIVNEQFRLIFQITGYIFPISMKFAIEKEALYISIENPVYGLKTCIL